MIHKASKLALAAAAALCLPAAAQAGTSTDTKAANFTVLNQCSITGANIDLGTFTAQQTWGDLGASIGHLNVGTNAYTPGSRGGASMKLGSVNCDWDLIYTLYIQGSSNDPQASKAIQLTVGGKTAPLRLYVKKIGGLDIGDENIPGRGISLGPDFIYWIGGAAPEDIEGNVLLLTTAASTAQLTDKFGTPGTYADTLTYTLNF